MTLPKLLLVEDNARLRSLLGTWLQATGYTVIVAESAEDALDVATDMDLLVTDIELPAMNGLDLAQHMARPTLFITGNPRFADAVRGRFPTAQFLVKPFLFQELQDAIQILFP